MNKTVEYLSSLQNDRNISLRVVQKLLGYYALHSGRSYNEIIDFYYDDKGDLERGKLIKQAETVLEKFYKDNIYYGDKVSYFYKVKDINARSNFAALLKELVITDSKKKQVKEILTNYPFPLDLNNLKKLRLNENFFIEIEISKTNRIQVIACSLRFFRQRVELDPKLYGTQFSRYDELFAYEKQYCQLFDSIVFHENKGIVEIQIDMTQPLSKDDVKMFVRDYRILLKKAYKNKYSKDLQLSEYNIFSKINELYLDDKGKTNVLNHKTGTDSIKRERMNSKKKDLNNELFHAKGYEAIDKETAFFEIQKVYDSTKRGFTIELGIVGGSRVVDEANPVINCAEYRGCIDKSDHDYLLNKLI